MTIEQAFILAAGFGTRMRPLTDNCPKPLLQVAGRTMLDRAVDACVAVGVKKIVVNLHYLGEMIETHLQNRLQNNNDVEIIFSWEKQEILDTGGGMKKALTHFDGKPFFALNSDVLWLDGKQPALKNLLDVWGADQMQALLMLYNKDRLMAHDRVEIGDYTKDEKGCLIRNKSGKDTAPYIFAGPRILTPDLFEDTPSGAFSALTLFDKAEDAGTLYGVEHDGVWYHVGTPEALKATEEDLKHQI